VSRRIAFVTILVLAMAMAMAMAVAVGCGGPSKTAPANSPSRAASPLQSFTPPPKWVKDWAARSIANYGDPHPVYAGWTLAPLDKLAPALGNPLGPYWTSKRHTKVYLIVLHGDFTNVPFLGVLSSSPIPVIHWLVSTLNPPGANIGSMFTTAKPPPSVMKLLHRFQL
jgi:hypothetical protein